MAQLLAKPDKLLLDHLLEVYELGKVLTAQLRLEKEVSKAALLACLMHDVGKSTKSFQDYVRGIGKKAYPHALASLPFVLIAEYLSLGRSFVASAAVLSHHSPLSGRMYEGWGAPRFYEYELENLLRSIFVASKEFPIDSGVVYSKGLILTEGGPSNLLHRGMMLLKEIQKIPQNVYASVKAVLHLADWLASAGLKDPSVIFLKNGDKKISSFVENRFTLWEFQKRSQIMKGKDIYLRAPTGSGKTEALLMWASNAKRVIYLLPTQATVNAMWKRLKIIYGEENVGISHGKAGYMIAKQLENESMEDNFLNYKLFASVFAKPVVVATIDQFLMAFMKGRHWEEKQTLCKHAAVIIDEVHCYEPFTLGILKHVLERYKFGKVAVASATLPTPILNLLGEKDLVLADKHFWSRRRYRIFLLNEGIDSWLERMVFTAKQNKRVLVVVNTVQKAQEIFEKVKDIWDKVFLLHSRFVYRDRVEKEKNAMEAERGTILIATQIVEVSLDISYDVLFTELAPIDALVQRMGRINRKGGDHLADVFIARNVDSRSEMLYGVGILEESNRILSRLSETPTEEDLVRATEALYSFLFSREEFVKDIKVGEKVVEEINTVLGNYTVDLSDEELRERFVTRKGIFSVDVIPEVLLEEAYKVMENGERWRLLELTVPIHGYWLKVWPERVHIDASLGYPILDADYDSEIGLKKPLDNARTFEIL